MSNIAVMFRGAALVVLFALIEQSRTLAACDPMFTEQRAVFDQTVAVNGGGRVKQSIHLTEPSSVIVIAAEHGVDIVLTVTDAAGRLIGRADNPIRRSGIQRVVFDSSIIADYTVELAGKEGAATRGTAQIRVITLRIAPTIQICSDIQRQLAAADSAYVAGLVASEQLRAIVQSTETTEDAPEKFKAAANGYIAMSVRLEKAGTPLLLARTRHAASAVLYQDLFNWESSCKWADLAVGAYQQIDAKTEQARARAVSAAARMEIAVTLPAPDSIPLDQRPSTLALAQVQKEFAALAAFHRQRAEYLDEALAVNNLGIAYLYDDRNPQAIQSFGRALQLYKLLAEQTRQALVLNNIAVAEDELGSALNAQQHFAQSLTLISATDEPKLYASALINKATLDSFLGQHDSAFQSLSAVLDILKDLQIKYMQAKTLHVMGDVYDRAGDQEQALHYYRQALTLTASESSNPARVDTLRRIANILRVRGQAAEALPLLREAMALQRSGTRLSIVQLQVAATLDTLGQHEAAARQLDLVLKAPPRNSWSQSQVLLARGQHFAVTGAFDLASRYLLEASTSFKKHGFVADEFTARLALATVQHDQGKTNHALNSVNAALLLTEELRQQSIDPKLRASVLQPLRPAYDLKIELLADAYFNLTRSMDEPERRELALSALQTAEQTRARALRDYQNWDTSSVSASLLQNRKTLLRELSAQRNQLETRLERGKSEDRLVQTLSASIASNRRRLDQMDVQIATASTKQTSTAVSPLTLANQIAQMPDDAAAVEYWLGRKRALGWVICRGQVRLFDLGSSEPISQATRNLHTALREASTHPLAERLVLGEQLYTLLIRPMENSLIGKRQLIFAPDAALHYLPFAALVRRNGNITKFLVQDYDIGITPAVSMLLSVAPPALEKPIGRDKALLLVSDPVYQRADTRFASNRSFVDQLVQLARRPLLRGAADIETLERLPGSAAEAQSIGNLFPPQQVERMEGFGANRDTFMATQLSQYQYIHVASHALVDTDMPQLSALVLSTWDAQGRAIDGRVMAADFLTHPLAAQLVVLSACDTALGKIIAGEGLMGLRYVMLARGAQAVVASLWQVPDEGSAALMSSFYGRFIGQHQSVATALSGAMRATITAQETDPAVWGAFAATIDRLPTR